MAEILGVVASGLSVVQIAGQLAGCVQQLRTFFRSMRDVPEDLQRSLHELQILGQIFCQMESFNNSNVQMTGIELLQSSLLNCQAVAFTLETLALRTNKHVSDRHKRHPWYVMKAALKKDEMKEMKERLDAAKSLLHLAMTCYQMTIQQQHLALLAEDRSFPIHTDHWVEGYVLPEGEDTENYGPVQANLLAQDKQVIQVSRLPKLQSDRLSRCATNQCCCSCHDYKLISGSFWSIRFPLSSSLWTACNRASCSNYKRASLWISLWKIGIPYAVIASFEMMWNSQNSFISPSLQMKRVVNWDAPAFRVLRRTQWNGIEWPQAREMFVSIFDSGQASPIDVLPNGMTLPEKVLTLPWPNADMQLNLLEFLVNMGAQINTTGLLYCAAQWNGLGYRRTQFAGNCAAHNNLLNNLLRLGLDPSTTDALSLSGWPRECSPQPEGRSLDPFFVQWIASLIKVSPGFAGLNPFLEAVLIESEDEVKARLTKYSIDEQDNLLRYSALHLAVSRPQHLHFLLTAGANVNARDWSGRTPLMYAAASGSVDVAISLLRAGADPWEKDDLYGREDFMEYAIRQDRWDLVIATLDHVRKSARYSISQILSLLNMAIIRWAGEHSLKRKSAHFKSLLSWGADPEILFAESWEFGFLEKSSTLLHCITDSTDFDILVATGFTKFNHSNSSGAHPLIKITALCDDKLLRKCIEGGSSVDHQDCHGRTALHVCVERLWDSFMQFEEDQRQYRSDAMQCARSLLEDGADPFLGDLCQCACSRAGCTPANILVKENRWFRENGRGSYPLFPYLWSLEWLQLLEAIKGVEFVKQSVLDMLRLVNFEELELTHTCCHKHHRKELWQMLDEDEVDEIMDEEKEIIEDLESHMTEIESNLSSHFDDILLGALSKLAAVRGQTPRTFSHEEETTKSSAKHQLDSQIQYGPACIDELSEYIRWMDYEKIKSPFGETTTTAWYEKRTNWLATFRNMIETG